MPVTPGFFDERNGQIGPVLLQGQIANDEHVDNAEENGEKQERQGKGETNCLHGWSLTRRVMS